MNIITADFSWISFLILIVAVIIGFVKSANAKKQAQKPVFQFPDFYEEDNNEEPLEPVYARTEYTPSTEMSEDDVMISDDYREPQQEEIALFQIGEAETEETSGEEERHFNLRQAIISSEILRRPEF